MIRRDTLPCHGPGESALILLWCFTWSNPTYGSAYHRIMPFCAPFLQNLERKFIENLGGWRFYYFFHVVHVVISCLPVDPP
jgi:hypothetical protein